MTDTEILNAIDAYCLSVRRIPNEVIELYDAVSYLKNRTLQDNEEIITWHYIAKSGDNIEEAKRNFYIRFPEGRKMVKKTRIPKNAGAYLVKSVTNTSSIINWTKNKYSNVFEGKTLEHAISNYLASK